MNVTRAVVTGAAGGIGRALATALRAGGADVVLADVDESALGAAAAELQGTAVRTDVSDPAAVEALGAAAGDVQLVCLNAGIVGADVGLPWEVGAADWDRVFAVNVGGVVNGLRTFVPRLLASGQPAHILITASLAGLATFPVGGAYAASKHAVVAVAEQAALGLADTPVGVTMLAPALVRTGMSQDGEDPADIAAEALAAIDAGRFGVIPGEWHREIVRRGERLAAGEQPLMPSPG
ncbi:SDR family NAD(P)-dependent oxidoreductase [Pseudonocardia sp. TRM90224]|uniref:SDR family NAD(P)-dependent oxidoreductase n=1 Tax=Pseudonocardia sp. TRM90224 TaxID=2812678 RepID=UPI001E51209B|nr:SDR family NAD(P)-dependent oxidoreductase [Pseudonocardia sp. TRM90224]